MGLLETVEGMAGQQMNGGGQGGAASGVLQALEEHPGGLSGVMDSFRQNGMAEHVQNWATGQQTATPDQIEQGAGGSGLIDSVAAKAHISPELAKVALATVLPLAIAHFTNQGMQEPPASGYQSGFGGIASQMLSRVL
jgi:uncharacterized protein YidB (DUF937 family)